MEKNKSGIDKLIEGNNDAAEKHRMAYAKEYAEQESIGFAEWLVDGTYDNVAGDYDGIVTFQKPTKELYQLYIKSKIQ